MRTQQDFYIITPRDPSILNSPRLLRVGEVILRGIASDAAIPLYVGDGRHSPIRYDDYFSTYIIFFIKECLTDEYNSRFGWIVNGIRFTTLIDEKTIKLNFDHVITSPNPLTPRKLLCNSIEEFHVAAKLLPEVVEALGVKFVDAHYRTQARGHEKCYEIWEINGEKVISWWTSCVGPGYSCSYEHPSGFEFYNGNKNSRA